MTGAKAIDALKEGRWVRRKYWPHGTRICAERWVSLGERWNLNFKSKHQWAYVNLAEELMYDDWEIVEPETEDL